MKDANGNWVLQNPAVIANQLGFDEIETSYWKGLKDSFTGNEIPCTLLCFSIGEENWDMIINNNTEHVIYTLKRDANNNRGYRIYEYNGMDYENALRLIAPITIEMEDESDEV